MSNIAYAAEKWEHNTANKEAKWENNVRSAPYCKGFETFLGHPAPQACSSWTAGINFAITNQAFSKGLAGKKSAYIAGLEHVS